jgi:molybdate transport system permease protein
MAPRPSDSSRPPDAAAGGRDPQPGALRPGRRALARAGSAFQRYLLAVVTLGFLAVFVAAVIGLVVADVLYEHFHFGIVLDLFRSREVVAAMLLSAYTSGTTLLLVVLFCIPIGYALSRYRFPGHAVADTIVDIPIVVPPIVIGLSLLVLFATAPGRWLERAMEAVRWDRYAAAGIILCQFLISVPYAIRSAKAAFDGVDRRLEDLALTLGCTRWRAFRRIALPLARNGIVAGCIMAWARAVGVFGPLIVFVGCVRMKSEVMPTTIYLEVSTGGIEVALGVAMVMMALAGVALVAIHALLAGRRGWEA